MVRLGCFRLGNIVKELCVWKHLPGIMSSDARNIRFKYMDGNASNSFRASDGHYYREIHELAAKYIEKCEKTLLRPSKITQKLISREGLSPYNKIYEFEYTILGQRCQMIMTSVSGHLLHLDFVGQFKRWQACNPLMLFDAPVMRDCLDDYKPIKQTLEREAPKCDVLIIWTDCDREGEHIGFEIIEVCCAVKPNLQVYRAKFSEITYQSVTRAAQNLIQPDKRLNDCVNVRIELDLRIGAAFTRFQTLRLQKVFPNKLRDSLISYGSCQFPTLGFVVERFNAIRNFIPEQFWKIKVTHIEGEITVEFHWKRVRLFDQLACQVLYDICMENTTATVERVQTKPKSKWRPLPLDTVELEKTASRKLRMNARETMQIAEKLYMQGFISYPRTETNIFPKEMNLRSLVEMQIQDQNWGEFASGILEHGPNPRQGRKSDQAHPPIHPTKYTNSLHGNEQRIYEFIVRHFLACCSQDAQGMETLVDIDIANEKFVASGLMIIARNYLDVYPYEKWNAKEIIPYQEGQTFEPTSINMADGETSAPPLLTEADLIALMEKHGIGTDATHADHIETIKSRLYVGLENQIHFVPGELGIGLVEGYDSMGFAMSKPHLRAELEADLKRICEGTKDPKVVLAEQIAKYREVFEEAMRQANLLDEALGRYLEEQQQALDDVIPMEDAMETVMKCPNCGLDMVLKSRRENNGKYIGCMCYPQCRAAIWFPDSVENVELSDEMCDQCAPGTRKLKFKFKRGSYLPYYPDQYTGCVGGCDPLFLEILGIRPVARNNTQNEQGGNTSALGSPANRSADSGYASAGTQRTIVNRTRPLNDANATIPGTQRPNIGRNNQRGRATNNNGRGAPAPVVNGRENAIVCHCNEDALLLTVRKDNPNKGRQFYKCAKPQGQGCNFFMWASDDVQTGEDALQPRHPLVQSFNNIVTTNMNGQRNDNLDAAGVVCHCGLEAKRLTVQKEGPNKGRQFYACKNPRETQCRFFKWADDDDQGGSGGWNPGDDSGSGVQWNNGGNNWGAGGNNNFGNWSGASHPRGRGRRGGQSGASRGTGPKQKRKCSVCGEEGHNKKNCPHSVV